MQDQDKSDIMNPLDINSESLGLSSFTIIRRLQTFIFFLVWMTCSYICTHYPGTVNGLDQPDQDVHPNPVSSEADGHQDGKHEFLRRTPWEQWGHRH